MSDQPLDPNALAIKVNDLRNRVLAGEPIEPEEYREVIASLRQARTSASATPVRAKAASKKVDPDSFIF